MFVNSFTCIRDQFIIRGKEYRNQGDHLPIMIISHGFMANMSMCKKYAKLLADKGYACYIFDFNGGGLLSKSSGKSKNMSVLTEVEDLKAVIQYTLSLAYTSDSITLMGCSQGGFVSALTASQVHIDKLILFYPALCIPDDARNGHMMFARFDPLKIPDQINCGPMKLGKCYVEDVITMDPYQEIRKYKGPVLIVHGSEDKIVGIQYAIEANKVYNNSILKIIKAGHMFNKKQDLPAMKYVYEFLEV